MPEDPDFQEVRRYTIQGDVLDGGCGFGGTDTVQIGGEGIDEYMVAMNLVTCTGIMARGRFLRDPEQGYERTQGEVSQVLPVPQPHTLSPSPHL